MQKLKNIYHLFQALIANIWYGFPSKKIKVIGVTGTDGKTTTTHLIYHILKVMGYKASMVSTVYAKVGNHEYDTGLHTTTPSSFLIQKLLKKAVDQGDEYFVLETTSHGLDQNRVWGIKYEIGVLTNVTHEHLDYHKTYEKYLQAKLLLFKRSKIAIVNKDDESYKYIKSQIKNSKFQIYSVNQQIREKFPDLVKFNQYNFSAAFEVAKTIGIKDADIFKAMNTFNLPKGRLELVYNKSFKVIIDFAHTPNAFTNLLPEIRKKYLKNKGRLIHVFGAAGLRDASKRPFMGEESAKYSDFIILTEEDYRSENPEKISESIVEGIKNKKPYLIIIDRKAAIQKAISLAKPGDVVVLTGKSHEKSLCRGKVEYPWSEHQAVKDAITKTKL